MSTSRQLLIGFVGLGIGVVLFVAATLMGTMLPNTKPPAWVDWVFNGANILGVAGVLVGIGLVLVALVRMLLGK